jgi:trk system potassium uptake protein TrkH
VIRYSALRYILGQFLLVLAATMLFPLAWGLLRGQPGVAALGWSALITGAAGLSLFLSVERPERDLNQREGLMLVVLTWFAVSLFGALPFVFSPHYQSVTDAVFESTSGFTTTGATVLDDVEVLSEPVQLWRHFSHWLGGMGIVLLGVAVLPLVGHGGMQLYRAEFSGARSEKLKARVTETAFALWKIYFAYTVAVGLALYAAGMTGFEALCHSFSTMATGGFSTRTASVGGFQSPLIEWIILVFMLLAGISFVQHYRLLVEWRPKRFFLDYEIKAYTALAVAATLVITFTLALSGYEPALALRRAAFQVVSILTTTGFATDDFEVWHPLAQLTLLALMFVGGCTGSTAGGLKVSRIVLLARVVDREFKRMVERRGVFAVRVGGNVIGETTVQSLLNLVYLSFVVNFVSCLMLAALGVDVLTAISAVAASMFNVGPSLGAVGPTEHYGHLPALAKWVLAVDMIAGRLEFYTLIVILTPAFWRK